MDRTSTIGTTAAAGSGSIMVGAVGNAKQTFTQINLAPDAWAFTFTIGDFFITAGFLVTLYAGYEAWHSKKERKRRNEDLL